jgi:hypothetical protein
MLKVKFCFRQAKVGSQRFPCPGKEAVLREKIFLQIAKLFWQMSSHQKNAKLILLFYERKSKVLCSSLHETYLIAVLKRKRKFMKQKEHYLMNFLQF